MLKNNMAYFVTICANFPCKIEKFELEVVGVGILGTRSCCQGSHNMYYKEVTAKRVTPISFFIFNKFEHFFYFIQKQHISAEKLKLSILDACVCKIIYIKKKLD